MKCKAVSSRTGKPCRNDAIRGGAVCGMHGGKAPQVRAAANRRLERERIEAMAARLGVPIEVDPAAKLLELIWESAGNVEFYRSLAQRLSTPGEPELGDELGRLYAPMVHQTGTLTGESRAHVVVDLYDAERDRLARLVQEALKLRLDERRVQMAESEGRELMRAVADAIAAAQLTPEQAERFRRELATRLRARIGAAAEPAGLPRAGA